MKVAISTKDGKSITTDHFGEGNWFLIYEIENGKYELVERRRNTTPPEDEHGSKEKAMGISSVLKDVDILFGFQFGPNIMRIKDKFLPVVSREKSIEISLKLFLRHYRDIEKELFSPRGKVGILDKRGVKFIQLREKDAGNF